MVPIFQQRKSVKKAEIFQVIGTVDEICHKRRNILSNWNCYKNYSYSSVLSVLIILKSLASILIFIRFEISDY